MGVYFFLDNSQISSVLEPILYEKLLDAKCSVSHDESSNIFHIAVE